LILKNFFLVLFIFTCSGSTLLYVWAYTKRTEKQLLGLRSLAWMGTTRRGQAGFWWIPSGVIARAAGKSRRSIVLNAILEISFSIGWKAIWEIMPV